MTRRSPIVAGGALALASAATFGATTPLVQRFGRGVGPFTTAALLYGGAALVSAVPVGVAIAGGERLGVPVITGGVLCLVAIVLVGLYVWSHG